MDVILDKILYMNMAACGLITAVILVRVLLQKAPKYIRCILWVLVAIRLVCPFSIESAFSLLPVVTVTDTHEEDDNDVSQSSYENEEQADDESSVVSDDNSHTDEAYEPEEYASVDDQSTDITGDAESINTNIVTENIVSIIWLLGMAVILVHSIISYFRLKRRVSTATNYDENIWVSDDVETPFILGVIRSRIYLPSKMDADIKKYVLAHEYAHISRKDHIWKPLGFLIVCVHWFNPLVWVAYVLFSRDVEMACDEKVIKNLDVEERKAYSKALLACSVSHKQIADCPVAFSEAAVKGRVKSVLNYKKPAFWGAVIALLLCVILAVGFMTESIEKVADEVVDSNSNVNPFNEHDKFLVMTGEMDEELFETVLTFEQRINILMAFNGEGTDIKEEYREALGLPTSEIGTDLVYYGQPINIYGFLILPDQKPSMSDQWIVPVFLDVKDSWNAQPMLGYYIIYELDDGSYGGPFWSSVLDYPVIHDSFFYDFENVSKIFSGSSPNLYIEVSEGVLLCNERGWFPLYEDKNIYPGLIEGYEEEEITAFATENSYNEIIKILEDDLGEELESVDIRECYLHFKDSKEIENKNEEAEIDTATTSRFLIGLPYADNVKSIEVTCGIAPEEINKGIITEKLALESILYLLQRISIIREIDASEVAENSNEGDIGYYVNIYLEDDTNISFRIIDREHFYWEGKTYLIKDLLYENFLLENLESGWSERESISIDEIPSF